MSKATRIGLIFLACSLLFMSGLLFILARSRFDQGCAELPDGSTIGAYSIAGLTDEQIVEGSEAIYNSPIAVSYLENEIQLSAPEIGLTLVDSDAIRRDLQAARSKQCSRGAFLNSLFGKNAAEPVHIEIRCSAEKEPIRSWLEREIVPRYDSEPLSAQPNTGGVGFYPSREGRKMNVDAAVERIAEALCAVSGRSAAIPVETVAAPPPVLDNLAIQVRSVIDQLQDAGQITEVVLIDPKTETGFDIARRDRADVPPEISFTAASTIKVPVMISSFIRMDDDPDALTTRQLTLMITESKNDQTDWMMENHVGGNLAPLTITEDMRKLGLENVFLAGYFYMGAPLLQDYRTPANSRADIDLKPDRYNQTTASDMAKLMEGLYRCAENGTGLLIEAFPEALTQRECGTMIDLLKNNKLPYLITAGIPDSVEIAHKHGWIEESDGLLHTMSNIAIVFSPNGDYILSIYTWHPTNLVFENGNRLFSAISNAVYNYFNPNLER